MCNGCTLIQSTTSTLRRKPLKYNQLRNRNPKYTTCVLVGGNADILVNPEDCNKETTSLKISLKTFCVGVSNSNSITNYM